MTTATIAARSVDETELEQKVKEMYRQVAQDPHGEFHFELGRALAERLGYAPEDLDRVPREAIESFAGVGYYFDLLELKPGEVISLIGESGSGKTTIGKILLRLVQPTSGTVTFDGKDIAKYSQHGLREYYRHVQGVFQDPFSSYNPIYKADRVFELIRGEYFADLPERDWNDKISSALEAVALNPRHALEVASSLRPHFPLSTPQSFPVQPFS